MCTCCRANEKTRDHIFNSGPRATHIWNFFQAPLGFTGQFPSLKQRCLKWWNQVTRNPLLRMVYQIAPSIICWFLWRARNEERFNSVKSSSSFIINNIVKLISSCVHLFSSKKKLYYWLLVCVARINFAVQVENISTAGALVCSARRIHSKYRRKFHASRKLCCRWRHLVGLKWRPYFCLLVILWLWH